MKVFLVLGIIGVIVGLVVFIYKRNGTADGITRSKKMSNYIRSYLKTGYINNEYFATIFQNNDQPSKDILTMINNQLLNDLLTMIKGYKKNLLNNIKDPTKYTDFNFNGQTIRKVLVGHVSIGVLTNFDTIDEIDIYRDHNHISIHKGYSKGSKLRNWADIFHGCGFTEIPSKLKMVTRHGYLIHYNVYAYITMQCNDN